ncbi:hypothetical protein YC2023_031269 [Brassica napus]
MFQFINVFLGNIVTGDAFHSSTTSFSGPIGPILVHGLINVRKLRWSTVVFGRIVKDIEYLVAILEIYTNIWNIAVTSPPPPLSS